MRLQLKENSPIETVDTREVTGRLNVTHLTVLAWRRGSRERAPLPVIYRRQGKSRRIKFAEADLRAYLMTYRPDLYGIWMHSS